MEVWSFTSLIRNNESAIFSSSFVRGFTSSLHENENNIIIVTINIDDLACT